MPTLVDYAVLQSSQITIQPGSHQRFPINFLPPEFVKGTNRAKPVLSYVCATHNESRLVIETRLALIDGLTVRGAPLEWRSLHHTVSGTAFNDPPEPFIPSLRNIDSPCL